MFLCIFCEFISLDYLDIYGLFICIYNSTVFSIGIKMISINFD